MNNNETLFFMLCPIVMALAWGTLFSILKKGQKDEKYEAMLNFTIGAIVTTVTTIIVLHNIREGKEQESYTQVNIWQKAVFLRFEERTSTCFDGEGNPYDVEEDWVVSSNETCRVSNIVGQKTEYRQGDSIFLYHFLDHKIISKNTLSETEKKQFANHHQMYTTYSWSFLWIFFSALCTLGALINTPVHVDGE